MIDNDDDVFTRESAAWEKKCFASVRAKTMQEAIKVMNNPLQKFAGVFINVYNINYIPLLRVIRDIVPNMPINVIMDTPSTMELDLATDNGVDCVHNWGETPDENVVRGICYLKRKDFEKSNDSRGVIPLHAWRNVIVIGDEYRFVFKDDRKIQITGKQFDVLFYIFREQGKLCNAEEILQYAWEDEYGVNVDYVADNLNKALRKLGVKDFIKNERNQGYRLVTE